MNTREQVLELRKGIDKSLCKSSRRGVGKCNDIREENGGIRLDDTELSD